MPQTTRVRGFKVTVSKAMLTANWITSCCEGKVYSGLQYLGHGNKIYHFVTQDKRYLKLAWRLSKIVHSKWKRHCSSTQLQSMRNTEVPKWNCCNKNYTEYISVFSTTILSDTEFYIFFFINHKFSCKQDICITSWSYPYIYFSSYRQTIR